MTTPIQPLKNLFLNGSKIYLRPLENDDAEFLCNGENDEKVRETLFLALPISPSDEAEKIRKFIAAKDTIIFTITLKKNNDAVGQTAFFRIDYVSRSAIFYLAILNPKFWSAGIGSEATQLMVKYAFLTLNLNRIQLHVNSENVPAIKIYQRCGFEKEGVLRQAMFKNGRYFDFWVMGVLRDEWLKKNVTAADQD